MDRLKLEIRNAQLRAMTRVNRDLIALYWRIGKMIAEKQQRESWGRAIVQRLASDLQNEFPSVSGFSPQNLWYMRAFYLAWTDQNEILQQPVGEMDAPPFPVSDIPWGHNIQLLEKLSRPTDRLWYARQSAANGWSRSVLIHQIETRAHLRAGRAITNFHNTLAPADSDLAQQLLKDPYNFDFLSLPLAAKERDLQLGLIAQIKSFLLELGVGFAFVGENYHLEVDGDDYYIDLLFYQLRLRRYVIIDLKSEEFKPEYAGKMNFYLSAVDDLLLHGDDQPSIGLLLCRAKRNIVAEYALRDLAKPIGVASFTVKLPPELRDCLPSARRLIEVIQTVEQGR